MSLFANPTNVTSAVGLFQYGNDVTNQMFMPAMLFVIWIILFVALKTTWRTEAALGSSTFSIMIVTIILSIAGLVTDTAVIVTVVAFLASMFLLVFEKDRG